MANERRLRANLQAGIITDDPLTTTTTVINSTQFATLPVVDGTSHLPIILNPNQAAVPSTNAEIVYITSHSSGATVATVVRAREGTAASGFNSTATWVHGPTVADHGPNIIPTSGSLPSSGGLPFDGQLAWIMDEKRLSEYNASTTAWVDIYNGGAWTSFTPTFRSGTGWAVGNATLTGKYKKIGRLVVVKIGILLGSTTTKGSGTLSIGGLPFANVTPTAVGLCNFNRASNGTDYPGQWYVGTGVDYGELRYFANLGTAGAIFHTGVTNTGPFTWATSDAIEATLVYESSS